MSYIKQNKKRKQKNEKAQYGLNESAIFKSHDHKGKKHNKLQESALNYSWSFLLSSLQSSAYSVTIL